jgi:hypothetical protein
MPIPRPPDLDRIAVFDLQVIASRLREHAQLVIFRSKSSDSIMVTHTFQKLRLPSIARVADRDRSYVQIGQCRLGVPADRDDRPRLQGREQPCEQVTACLTFGPRMAAVRHRLVGAVRM